jgi:hypothetical protein
MTRGQDRLGSIGRVAAVVAALSLASCTLYHSKIPVTDLADAEVSDDSVFVTEDDSGLALLGLFVVSEPDHYSVLVERARRRYKCVRLHHIQLDFYSDYWIFVGFPIARITAICEREEEVNKAASPRVPKASEAPETPEAPKLPEEPDLPEVPVAPVPDVPTPEAAGATGPG